MPNSTTSSDRPDLAWSGMVPVDDTALAVTDTGGSGPPVLYLNGAYADQSRWRPVRRELGTDWRHITFDGRARGRSKRSSDYSFEACLRDVDTVLTARCVDRALLVGWSYGAAVAVRWADHHPDRTTGVVSADGAYPYDWIDDAARDRLRTTFRRMRFLLPLVRPLGLAARMSADQHAEVNIELNEILGALGPVLERIRVPVRYVVATGDSLGSSGGEQERMRATLDPVLAHNPYVTVSAKVASSHSTIISRDFRAVADAVRELSTARDREIG